MNNFVPNFLLNSHNEHTSSIYAIEQRKETTYMHDFPKKKGYEKTK